jgi:trigger factor
LSSTKSCKQELEISVPWEEVEQETGRIVKAIRGNAKIPGFRPGKAPDTIVRSRYQKEIRQEIIDKLVPRFFWEQAQQQNLRVVGSPQVDDLHLENGEAMRFRAEFEVYPDFELGDYRRLEVPFREPEVSEEEVEQELQRIREQHASFRNLDPRPLADGDIAVLSLKGTSQDGAPPIEQEETTVTIGNEETLPEFNEHLRGKSPGDEVDFEVRYPDDFSNRTLAGKSFSFHAEVKGLREKELPELNDDFAADLGDFRTLEEVRRHMHELIENQRRRQATEAAQEALIDELIKGHDFPVPEGLVDRQIATRLERQLRSLKQQGVDVSKLDWDWDKVRDEERERASRDVKASLLLERIAKAENISASSEEIDEQVKRYAEQTKQSPAAAREKLAEEGALDRMQVQMSNDKTLSFLFDEAEKVDQEVEAT